MRAGIWRAENSRWAHTGCREQHGRTLTTVASGVLSLIGFVTHASLAGGFTAAMGFDGMSGARDVPLSALGFCLLGIAAGFWHVVPNAWLSPSAQAAMYSLAPSTEMASWKWNASSRPAIRRWPISSTWLAKPNRLVRGRKEGICQPGGHRPGTQRANAVENEVRPGADAQHVDGRPSHRRPAWISILAL